MHFTTRMRAQLRRNSHMRRGLFRLRIRDDGSGIDPHVLDQGNGRDIGVTHGIRSAPNGSARIEFWSQPGAGTEIELSIPGAIAFGQSPMQAGLRRFRKKTGTIS